VNITACSDIMNICEKPSAPGSSCSSDRQSVSQMVSPIINALVPLSVGVISSITLSVVEALDSTQRISAFLTGLRDKEADQADNLNFSFNSLGSLVPFND
jgi:hypothetical protein